MSCKQLQSFLRNWKGFGDILDVYRCTIVNVNVIIVNVNNYAIINNILYPNPVDNNSKVKVKLLMF